MLFLFRIVNGRPFCCCCCWARCFLFHRWNNNDDDGTDLITSFHSYRKVALNYDRGNRIEKAPAVHPSDLSDGQRRMGTRAMSRVAFLAAVMVKWRKVVSAAAVDSFPRPRDFHTRKRKKILSWLKPTEFWFSSRNGKKAWSSSSSSWCSWCHPWGAFTYTFDLENVRGRRGGGGNHRTPLSTIRRHVSTPLNCFDGWKGLCV